jgi:hypothetical protein
VADHYEGFDAVPFPELDDAALGHYVDANVAAIRSAPVPDLALGSPGFDIVTRTHVEGHAAALMQQQGITQGTLYINNPAVCTSCSALLPRMLAPGSTLNVVLPNGTVITFTGSRP